MQLDQLLYKLLGAFPNRHSAKSPIQYVGH